MRTTHIVRIAMLALGIASASCSSQVRQGTGTSYLIVNQLEFAPGSEPGSFTSLLLSDVITVVDTNETFFNDLAQVTFSLGLKDPGPATGATSPTPNQFITVDRYHVRFIR